MARQHAIPERNLHEVQLALEEHLTNIVRCAYDDEREHHIKVVLNLAAPELQIQIEDDGRPFNPLAHPAPDLTLPIEKRPVGGLGIHMMKESLDAMAYRRENRTLAIYSPAEDPPMTNHNVPVPVSVVRPKPRAPAP